MNQKVLASDNNSLLSPVPKTATHRSLMPEIEIADHAVIDTCQMSSASEGGGGVTPGGGPPSTSHSRRNSRRSGFNIKMPTKMGRKFVGLILRAPPSQKIAEGVMTNPGMGDASVYHALVVIFLEFFAWGLLTSPMITVLNETFPEHTFLMNGIIVGIKGFLSFLSAPLVGALSDYWGRKPFLLITVFFTCAPIPLMKLNSWWYFATISISGAFAVTFSVVFAYVADVTEVRNDCGVVESEKNFLNE